MWLQKIRIGILSLLFSLISATAFAQFGDAGLILRAGQQDANTLLREYFKPVGIGFGTNLNSGWFNTAKTHSLLGFDISVNASIAMVPDSDLLFNIQNLNLNEMEYISGGPDTPTAAGDNVTGALIGSKTTYTDPNTNETKRMFEFEMPQGSGVPYIPTPMAQVSVGLIKGTDVTVRFLPSLPLPNDVELNLFGVGVKHEINQWLPGGKLIPVDLSIQAGFTNLDASVAFEVLPVVDNDTENPYPASTWEGQKAEFSSSSFTINALVGKTLPIISVYGGVGYQKSTVDIGTPGSYPLTVRNPDHPATSNDPKLIDKVDDPINLTYDNGGFHGLVGARFRLLILNISASYTISEYPVAQVGVGIGIR